MTARLARILFYYVMGCGLDETSGYPNGPSAVNPLWDGHFLYGLEALLDVFRRAPRTLPA